MTTSCWFCSFSAPCRETFIRSAAVFRPALYKSRNSACGWVIAFSFSLSVVPPLLQHVVFPRLENNIRRFRTVADKKNQIALRAPIDGKHRPSRRLPQAPQHAPRGAERGRALL